MGAHGDAESLVIVGASLAGLRAAQAARAGGWEGEVVVLGDEPHLPYTRPPLSKGVLSGAEELGAGAFPRRDLEVTWRLETRATGLDLAARILLIAEGDPVPFDRLVLATGSRARPWSGPGSELDGLHTLRDLDDAAALQRALATQPRLVVIGAGFIGCEVAASARTLGLDVTLVDIAPIPMPGLGETLGTRCAELHRNHGVDLRLGAPIAALHGDGAGRIAEVELSGGERLEADLALIALGAIPNTEWLAGSGLQLEPGVVCDAQLGAVGAVDVFCAGDITAWPHPLAGDEPIRIEHWTNAAEQGTLAGRNAVAAPEDREPYTAVPSFWSDQYDVKFQALGFPRLADDVRVVEAAPDGGRFVAIGAREGRAVAAMACNGARRLASYRRHVAEGTALEEVVAAAAVDPKAFGAPTAVGA